MSGNWPRSLCTLIIVLVMGSAVGCRDQGAGDQIDPTGIWIGEYQDAVSPLCLRLVIHRVANALGVVGSGLAVQGRFVACDEPGRILNGLEGIGRQLDATHTELDVQWTAITPSGGFPVYRVELTQSADQLFGLWRLRGDTAAVAIPIHLVAVAVNTAGLPGRYVVTRSEASGGLSLPAVVDTLQLAGRGSFYHSRNGGAALGEYNRIGAEMVLREFFPIRFDFSNDTLYIVGNSLVRRRISIHITNPALRDTATEVYSRR